MADPITMTLPEALLEQARAEATLSNRPLEAVLMEWLRRGAPSPEYTIYTPLGLDAAVQPLMDALAADAANNSSPET